MKHVLDGELRLVGEGKSAMFRRHLRPVSPASLPRNLPQSLIFEIPPRATTMEANDPSGLGFVELATAGGLVDGVRSTQR